MLRDESLLNDIIESGRLAISYVEGKSYSDFAKNIPLQDSVIRRIEIIGEAARQLSSETIEAIPSIPWHEVISMRNFLIHDYKGVDTSIVWETASRDIPRLIAEIRKFLEY